MAYECDEEVEREPEEDLGSSRSWVAAAFNVRAGAMARNWARKADLHLQSKMAGAIRRVGELWLPNARLPFIGVGLIYSLPGR